MIPWECVVPQHKLVLTDFCFRIRVHWDKCAKITRMKWWKLRGEAAQMFKERMLGEGLAKKEKMLMTWLKMGTCVRKVALEVLGVSREGK